MESFLDEMRVDDQITFSEKELRNVADILQQIELIVNIDNYNATILSPLIEEKFLDSIIEAR